MMETARAGNMLELAHWAAERYASYDKAAVDRIVRAVADAAYDRAEEFAQLAVDETGMGVVEHKVVKNRACSRGIVEHYSQADFVSPVVDSGRKIAEIPRPAGVVLAVTPTTNPVATVYFKTLLALMTRNAVVIAPHPRAKQVCAEAAHTLATAAEAAGAPAGIVQVVDEPTVPLLQALMADERTDVIVATGGTAVVRAAHSSGNPALGVGPGNVPVLVDATADLSHAARQLVDSKAFDNSVLCTNESVLIVEDSVADAFERELERAGAMIVRGEDAVRLRAYMFLDGHLNTDVVGKSASWIAEQAGFRVTAKTRCLIVPVEHALPEDPMTHEKLSPVLGMVRVPDAERGIEAARAIVRIQGAGHSAAIHSESPDTIMRYAARVPVLRVSVNVGNSTGSSGLDTNLAPSMTIGTGFVGRSSVGENLEPKHLVNWAKVAFNADDSIAMSPVERVQLWNAHPATATPPYPVASNDRAGVTTATSRVVDRVAANVGTQDDAMRDEIRRLVVEELSNLMRR